VAHQACCDGGGLPGHSDQHDPSPQSDARPEVAASLHSAP
jgi:hypothetical protein